MAQPSGLKRSPKSGTHRCQPTWTKRCYRVMASSAPRSWPLRLHGHGLFGTMVMDSLTTQSWPLRHHGHGLLDPTVLDSLTPRSWTPWHHGHGLLDPRIIQPPGPAPRAWPQKRQELGFKSRQRSWKTHISKPQKLLDPNLQYDCVAVPALVLPQSLYFLSCLWLPACLGDSEYKKENEKE